MNKKDNKKQIEKSKDFAISDYKVFLILDFLVIMACFLYTLRYVILNQTLEGWTAIDKQFYDYIKVFITVANTRIVKVITLLGKEILIGLNVIWVITYLVEMFMKKKSSNDSRKEKKSKDRSKIVKTDASVKADKSLKCLDMLFLPIATLVTLFINYSLKLLVDRTRPDILRLVCETSNSFPSSHTACSTFFYFMLVHIVVRKLKKSIHNLANNDDIYSRKKITKLKTGIVLLKILAVIMPLIIGLSRIYLGVHYFTDVASAIMLGGMMYILGSMFYDYMAFRIESKNK